MDTRAAPHSGSSVGLSSKGLTLAIGGPGDNDRVGAVWIFTSTDGGVSYQEEAKLVGTGNNGASKQGTSLALSSDGQSVNQTIQAAIPPTIFLVFVLSCIWASLLWPLLFA